MIRFNASPIAYLTRFPTLSAEGLRLMLGLPDTTAGLFAAEYQHRAAKRTLRRSMSERLGIDDIMLHRISCAAVKLDLRVELDGEGRSHYAQSMSAGAVADLAEQLEASGLGTAYPAPRYKPQVREIDRRAGV